MARVVLSPRALADLDRLIATLSLPPTTRARVRDSLRAIATFPRLGAPLGGRWRGYRFALGPWRWMIVVYEYDEAADRVAIVTVQDGRSARPPTAT